MSDRSAWARRHVQIAGISRYVVGTASAWKQVTGTAGKLAGMVTIQRIETIRSQAPKQIKLWEKVHRLDGGGVPLVEP
jgi:hypothetical protein